MSLLTEACSAVLEEGVSLLTEACSAVLEEGGGVTAD